MLRAFMLALLCLCFAAPAEAANTLQVSPNGSDAGSCSAAAPCRTLARAYAVAANGDTVEVAAGRYPSQSVPAGSKAVTFKGSSGVLLDQLWNDASGLTYDGINVDGRFVRKQTGLQLSGNRVTFKNAEVGNLADEKNIVSGDGHVIDNVRFHDVVMTRTGESEGVHMECLYSQASNITIKNSRFENCAVMDVFFTRGTWWGQPEYGGWTLINNSFDAPRFTDGRCCHYYAVYWAWQSKYDRAVLRGNTYKAGVAATDMSGANASFTNSVESCNTPAFNLRGLTKGTCTGTEPAPSPSPSPTPVPVPPAPTPTPVPVPPAPTPTPVPVPPAPVPVPPTPPTTSLVGAWGFNSVSNTTVPDSSGQGNKGTVSGAAYTPAGKFGGALSFDGIDDMVTVADSTSLDLSSSMTIEAWVNPTAVSGYRTAVFKEHRSAGRQAYALYATNGNAKPTAEVSTGNGLTTLAGSQTIAANTWTHIATTYDGSTLRVFKNGVQIGSRALTGSFANTVDPLRMGGNKVWSEWFKGRIDEVRVWKGARTPAQIATDMNAAI